MAYLILSEVTDEESEESDGFDAVNFLIV